MKILFIETEHRGHHIALHFNLLLKEVIKKNWEVLLLTQKNVIKSPSYKLISRNLINKIKVYYSKDLKFQGFRNIFYLLYIQCKKYFYIRKKLKKILNKEKPDIVYFITLDHFDKMIAIFGLPKKSVYAGMLIYSKIYVKLNALNIIGHAKNFLRNYLIKKLLSNKLFKQIFFVDKFLFNFIKKKKIIGSNKISYINDPGVIHYKKANRYLSRKKYKINSNKFVILVYGAIKKSKSIPKLIEAIKKLNNDNIVVIIAGEQTKEMEIFLKNKLCLLLKKKNRIKIYKGFKSYKEESHLISLCDVLWVAYDKTFDGSSSILHQGGCLRKPVITSNHGFLSYLNRTYKIGVLVNERDSSDIKKKINYLIKEPTQRKFFGNNNFILSKIHSGNNFSKTIINNIYE